MKILELFAGSQPITRAAREYGHDTIRSRHRPLDASVHMQGHNGHIPQKNADGPPFAEFVI